VANGQLLLLRSVDDYLGPGETRFFSRGYQRAEYAVPGVAGAPAAPAATGVTAEADIGYPADWSRKKAGADLRPHLSTVDALVLGVQLAEVHLAHAHRLGPEERRTLSLRKVALRAGTAPQEELRGVRLSAVPVRTGPAPGAPDRLRSVYECTVGGLRVRCEVDHPSAGREDGGARHASLEDALGPGGPRFYGEGFKLRRHTIEDVRVDMASLTARGGARFTAAPGAPVPGEGTDGATQPAVSLVDCFVVNLQLAQVLMYELDGLSRESSNTLWMMQTVLEAPDVPHPLPQLLPDAPPGLPEPLEALTSVTGKRLLPLRGGTWRSVDLRGGLAGIRMRSSFAHELPDGTAPAAP
jgi:hypothetical protein